MLSTRHLLLVIFFVVNTAFLCAASIFYSLDCLHYDQKCAQGSYFITIIFSVCAVFYAIICFAAIFYYARQHYLGMDEVYFINFMMTLTASSFVFAIVTSTCLIVSLFFGWDPATLDNQYKKTHFVLMWVLAVYSVLASGLLLAIVLLFSYQHTHRHPKLTAPEIYVSPPDGHPVSAKTIALV